MKAADGNPVHLYCPTNFAPGQILPAHQQRFGDGIVYLFHAIMMRRVKDPRYRKGHNDGFVGLKAPFLRNIVGRHAWPRISHLAITNGLVERDERYCVESRAKGTAFPVPTPRQDGNCGN